MKGKKWEYLVSCLVEDKEEKDEEREEEEGGGRSR